MHISSKELFNLVSLYSEPHRHYHNTKHIWHCFGELEDFTSNSNAILDDKDIRKLEYAIWYHDAIYNPFSKLNEQNSANLFSVISSEKDKFDYDEIEEIKNLILCTKNHEIHDKAIFNSELQKIICDIDLSILGQEPETYLEYSKNIRKEYAHISFEKYKLARIGFINLFLIKKKVFKTAYFQNKYENSVRKNLNQELENLTQLDFFDV
jgi:predicted metal-dependent HD superfamily phosphohydrolase